MTATGYGHCAYVHDGDDLDDFFQSGSGSSADAADAVEDPPTHRVPPRLGLLAQLSEAEFDQVARAAKLSFVEPGTDVFQQGDEADRFFILVDGRLDVVRDGERIATLNHGAFFGESALLVGGRRSASVTAPVRCTIWSVSYDAFDGAVSKHLLADDEARREAERRIAQTPTGGFDG